MQNISREIADCFVLMVYYIRAGNCVINLAIIVLILSAFKQKEKEWKIKIMFGILSLLVKKA